MTTTYYQQPNAAAPPVGRNDRGYEFGYVGSHPPMPNYLPTTVTQPAAPRTSNALRSGVIALGAVVAVGAGALL